MSDNQYFCKLCEKISTAPKDAPVPNCFHCGSCFSFLMANVACVKQPTPFTREDYIASLRRMAQHIITVENKESPYLEEEIKHLESL